MSIFHKDEQIETEILKGVERVERGETVIQREIQDLPGQPTNRQRTLLEDLVRLHRSLRGPENVLDRGNYSRPFPPAPVVHKNGNPYVEGTRTSEGPFGQSE